MLTGLLLEVDRLSNDEGSNLVFDLKLPVRAAAGEVVLLPKAGSPNGRLGAQDSVSDLLAD